MAFVPGSDPWKAFEDLDDAREHAKKLSLSDPKSKVVIMTSYCVVEPRRVDFSEKLFNDQGELLV